jgi:LmbE family N-acetylglucosaminyl deacetylase
VATVSTAALADRRIHGTGTVEASWSSWPGWAAGSRCTLADLVPDGSTLVVLAPHPDDETLGSGGLLHAAAQAGRGVTVLAVTGGDQSHPNSTRWTRAQLIEQRRLERRSALELLGVGEAAVTEIGLPDGAVASHLGVLVDAIRSAVWPGDVVVAPWRFDGHPDHEAVCEAALLACGAGVRLLQVPIWGWHWTHPQDGFLPTEPLLFPLPAPSHAAKLAAIEQFGSQLQPDPSTASEPILPSWALPRWQRQVEVYLP